MQRPTILSRRELPSRSRASASAAREAPSPPHCTSAPGARAGRENAPASSTAETFRSRSSRPSSGMVWKDEIAHPSTRSADAVRRRNPARRRWRAATLRSFAARSSAAWIWWVMRRGRPRAAGLRTGHGSHRSAPSPARRGPRRRRPTRAPGSSSIRPDDLPMARGSRGRSPRRTRGGSCRTCDLRPSVIPSEARILPVRARSSLRSG